MALLDRAKLTSGVALALSAACSTAGVHGGSNTGGNGGAVGLGGGTGTTSTTSSTVATSTSITTGVGGAGGSGGASPTGCDPPPDPSTLWAQKAISYPSYQEGTLCPYVGQVLLVVNTAAV